MTRRTCVGWLGCTALDADSCYKCTITCALDMLWVPQGAIAYLCVTAHMLIWFIKWAYEGNFWHNIFSINELRISPTDYVYDADSSACVVRCFCHCLRAGLC